MLYVNADERVLGYLGRALSFEFSAVQQYSTQARLATSWGLAEAAEQFSTEANEELKHVDRIIGRMLALGVAPNASQLRPVKLGKNLSELLSNNVIFENEIIKFYQDATRYCASVGDHDNRLFFETLLNEEKEHSAEFSRWRSELQQTTSGTTTRTTF